jgi:hypothetical protein
VPTAGEVAAVLGRIDRAADLPLPPARFPVRLDELTRFDAADRVVDFLPVDRTALRFAVEAPPRRAAFLALPAREPLAARLAVDAFLPFEVRLEAFFAIPKSFPLKWLASYCRWVLQGRKVAAFRHFSPNRP